MVFLVACFSLTGEQVTNLKSIAFAALYSYNFIPKAWYSGILGHTWSLAVEEHFYIIWPFIFVCFAYKLKKLILLTLSLILISFALAITLTNIEWLNNNFFLQRWSFIAGANIALGALLALAFNDEKIAPNLYIFLALKHQFFLLYF